MLITQKIQIVTYTGEDTIRLQSSLTGMSRVTKVVGINDTGSSVTWLSTSMFPSLPELSPQESYLVYSSNESGEETFSNFNLIDGSDGIPLSVTLDRPVQFGTYCGPTFDLLQNDFVDSGDDDSTPTTTTPAVDDWQHESSLKGKSSDEFFGRSINFTNDDTGVIIGRPSAELATDLPSADKGGFSFYTITSNVPSPTPLFEHVNDLETTEFGKHVFAFDTVDDIYIVASATGENSCVVKMKYDKSTEDLTLLDVMSRSDLNESSPIQSIKDQAAHDLSVSDDLSVIACSNPFDEVSSNPSRGLVSIFAIRHNFPFRKRPSDIVKISGGEENAQFGKSIAVNASATYLTEAIIAVGAPKATQGSDLKAGSVKVYKIDYTNNNTQVQLGGDLADVTGFTPVAGAFFGSKVAISGDGLVVAASEFDPATSYGAVHIFSWTGSAWVFQQTLSNNIDFEYFGQQIKLNNEGSVVAVGSENSFPNGKVQVYYDAVGAPAFTYAQMGRTLRPSIGSGASTSYGKKLAISRNADLVAVGYDHSSGGLANVGASDFYSLDNAALPTPAPVSTTQTPPTITIGTQPQATTATGSTAQFTIAATSSDSGTVNYQWYKRTGQNSSQPVGSDSSTLTLTGLTASDHASDIFCRVTRLGALATSDVVVLTVTSLSIAAQPVSTSINPNNNTEFSVAVNASGGSVEYIWQVSDESTTSTQLPSDSSFSSIDNNSRGRRYDTTSGNTNPRSFHRCVVRLRLADNTVALTIFSPPARHHLQAQAIS